MFKIELWDSVHQTLSQIASMEKDTIEETANKLLALHCRTFLSGKLYQLEALKTEGKVLQKGKV